jgi:HprK-related kinase B
MSDEERERFSRYAPEELWEIEHKYDALVHVCFGPKRFEMEAELVGLGILNWRRDGSALAVDEVDLAQRRDLLPAVMKSPGVFYTSEPGEPRVEFGEDRYLEQLRGVSVLEFAGGVDFPAATRACLDFLRGSTTS